MAGSLCKENTQASSTRFSECTDGFAMLQHAGIFCSPAAVASAPKVRRLIESQLQAFFGTDFDATAYFIGADRNWARNPPYRSRIMVGVVHDERFFLDFHLLLGSKCLASHPWISRFNRVSTSRQIPRHSCARNHIGDTRLLLG